MSRPLHFGQLASDEFREAASWYESRRHGLGAEFFDAVSTAIALIQTNPEIGAKHSTDGNTRCVPLDRFPYQVVYRLRPDDIVIVAIAHLKRRPGYWKNRN